MPAAPGERGRPVCWNCDNTVDGVITLTFQPRSGNAAILRLCRSCYASAYVPLAAQTPELVPSAPHTRRLLIVDDDPGIRGMLVHLFEGEGFDVDSATNGLEALQKGRAHVPDAIVLDLRMPVMSGQEFLRVWRRSTPNPAVPVLAMSAYDVGATAEELGVQAFLPKPFSMGALLSTMDHLVGLPSPLSS